MGTPCIIAAESHDGSLKTAICFLDGNPEQAGRKLLAHYSQPDAVSRLIALRAIYSLGNSPDNPLDYHRPRDLDQPVADIIRTLERHCITLNTHIATADQYRCGSLEELSGLLKDSDILYAYVYGEGGWLLLQYPNWQPEALVLHPETQNNCPQ